MKSRRAGLTSGGDVKPIDELISIEVNGTKQWLLCRSHDASKPVVLFVHGGPGYPLMCYSRGLDDHFLDDFVVVHWDQRKSGKSASADIPVESCTLQQIVDDGLQVTHQLKRKFAVTKVLLVGHSWGTMVAANMARQQPGDFEKVLLVGTCANWKRGEQDRYAEMMQIAKDRRDAQSVNELRELGPPPYLTAHQIAQFGELIAHLKGYSGTCIKLSEKQLIEAIEKNREYTSEEIATAIESMQRLLDHMSPFLNSYVLHDDVTRLEVPVHFVQGEHDLNTPTYLAKDYCDKLSASRGKHWHLFEGTAHMAMYEDPQKFLTILKGYH